MAGSIASWPGANFPDQRLKSRMSRLLARLSKKIGNSLPTACQDWAATKAAYRFLDNPRVNESIILAGHFEATRARFASADGPVLVLHDTTEFSFTRSDTQAIGQTREVASGQKNKDGRQRMHTVCGILMHSSLAVTTEGLPLGLAAIKLWTRKKFKGTNALKGRGIDGGKQSVNTTRIPIEKKESIRWLENVRQAMEHLGDPGRCIHTNATKLQSGPRRHWRSRAKTASDAAAYTASIASISTGVAYRQKRKRGGGDWVTTRRCHEQENDN